MKKKMIQHKHSILLKYILPTSMISNILIGCSVHNAQLSWHLWAVFALLLLPKYLVSLIHHCPCQLARDLGSRLSGLVFKQLLLITLSRFADFFVISEFVVKGRLICSVCCLCCMESSFHYSVRLLFLLFLAAATLQAECLFMEIYKISKGILKHTKRK